jgi:hypothetical protein
MRANDFVGHVVVIEDYEDLGYGTVVAYDGFGRYTINLHKDGVFDESIVDDAVVYCSDYRKIVVFDN